MVGKGEPNGINPDDLPSEDLALDEELPEDLPADTADQEIDPETREDIFAKLEQLATETEKNVLEPMQLRELEKWRDTEFKDSMREIIEAQQEICGEEGNQDACAEGQRIWEEMFGEPWQAESAKAE